MNLSVGRCGADATEHNALNAKSIGSAEERAYVLCRTHIVQDHNHGQLIHLGILLKGGTTEFLVE
jgi:hypothetical protein